MILAADIGNSSITLGVFSNNDLIEIYRIDSDCTYSSLDFELKLKELLTEKKFKGCIICSVVDEITQNFKQACDNVLNLDSVILSSENIKELKLEEKTKHTIGADRLANAFGALKYPLPAIVVDVGTAITFDIIDKNKAFLGGVIMPGLNLQMKSLWENTSKLPMIEVKNSPVAIGYNTETCILSGVVRGTASAIDGLLTQCEKELGENATVIVTGGQAELITKYTNRKFDITDPNFTLYSLKLAYDKTC